MKLSTRGRYGTRLMIELAKSYGKGPLRISEISRSQGITVKYLEQLIIPLKKANLISSVRGPKGGHMLTKSPDRISLWEVLNLLEKNLTLVDCVHDGTPCQHAQSCAVRPVWGKAYDAMMSVLKETTLMDAIDSAEKGKT